PATHLTLHPFPTRRSSDLPSSGIASHDEPAPPQLLVQSATKVGAVLDLHALDTDVDSAETAAQRHHGLRASLANEGHRWPSNDTDRKSTRLNSSHVKISYA